MGTSHAGRSKNKRRAHADRFSEINITPMVDVMLVLLIIFMVAAPMMTSGVTVDLPEASSAPVPTQEEPLSITVTSAGKVYIQKTQVQIKELQPKLVAIDGKKKDKRIFVRGDKNIDYGKMMQVVGEINAAGFNKVALITDSGGSDNASDK